MTGTVYKHGDLTLYAENGVIHMHHRNPKNGEDSEHVEMLPEFRKRIMGLRGITDNLEFRYSLNGAERDTYESARKLASIGYALIKEATDQGDPSLERVRAEKYKEFKLRKKYTVKPDARTSNATTTVETGTTTVETNTPTEQAK